MKFSGKMLHMMILSHKKPGLQPLFKRHIFGKTSGGPSAFKGLTAKSSQLFPQSSIIDVRLDP